ncbi:MAG: diaminopimelate epimerase [Pirellulales bacterium]|nr:diaminopimelate epimerase [Pirellulales bacterium]
MATTAQPESQRTSSPATRLLPFTKMQGAGNDYVYVNCFEQADVWSAVETPGEIDVTRLACEVSDRHFGIGGDGLILIGPSETADARMRMFNADGSEAQMCGNGIRCVAKYLFDHGICRQETLHIETGAGVLELQLFTTSESQPIVDRVRVDMGKPTLRGEQIPSTFSGEKIVNAPLSVAGHNFAVTCVSMGNPHCIIYVDEPTDELVLGIGPQIERDSHFPERVNAEFVQVISPDEIRMRVWERGSGETLACGTGASAVCVAGVLAGKTNRKILAHLVGGDLELEWAENDHVFMTGPAVEVFSGKWPITKAANAIADKAN